MVTPFDMDSTLFLAMNGDAGWFVDQIMWYASQKFTWIPLYAAILWWVWKTKGCKYLLIFLATVIAIVALSDITCNFFKANFPKYRPTHYPPLEGLVHTVNAYVGGLYGTVSAHAATTAAMAVVFIRVIQKNWVCWALSAWLILVCYSRIYLGVHYPVDVLLGLITGICFGMFGYKSLTFLVNKWIK